MSVGLNTAVGDGLDHPGDAAGAVLGDAGVDADEADARGGRLRADPGSVGVVLDVDAEEEDDGDEGHEAEREEDRGEDGELRLVDEGADGEEEEEDVERAGREPEEGQRDRRLDRGAQEAEAGERRVARRLLVPGEPPRGVDRRRCRYDGSHSRRNSQPKIETSSLLDEGNCSHHERRNATHDL